MFDEFINMDILSKLSNKNINIIVAEEVCEKDIRYYSDLIPKRIFFGLMAEKL